MHIVAYDHVGTRVSDRAKAWDFYRSIGFHIESENENGIDLINDYGMRINLIVNAKPQANARNVLLDEPTKLPGHTHIAFVVASLQESVAFVNRLGVRITEGPTTDERRRFFFIRDPDGNVLEFNELVEAGPA